MSQPAFLTKRTEKSNGINKAKKTNPPFALYSPTKKPAQGESPKGRLKFLIADS